MNRSTNGERGASLQLNNKLKHHISYYRGEKILRKTLSIVLIVIVIAFFYVLYRFGQFDSKLALSNQLENIIHEHDPAKIQTISLDQPTNEYYNYQIIRRHTILQISKEVLKKLVI